MPPSHALQSEETRYASVLHELHTLFNVKDERELFSVLFFWYFAPSQAYRNKIADDAHCAYQHYMKKGSLPEFFERVPTLFTKFKMVEGLPLHRKPSESETFAKFEAAWQYASEHCTEMQCHPHRPVDSPLYWKFVFRHYFEKKPTGDSDPLWDVIFDVLRKIVKARDSGEYKKTLRYTTMLTFK